jgi:casein kinase II subunit beta
MMEKFKNCDFGRCPRVYCNGQACLPVGLSDIPRQSTVKLFCPKCEDVYYPRSKYHGNLDGAYFGTTFAHLFQLTYPQLRPQKPTGTKLGKKKKGMWGMRASVAAALNLERGVLCHVVEQWSVC